MCRKPAPALARAGFLCLALLAPVLGATQLRDSHDYLARIDRSGDGLVSLAEYQQWMGYAFARMDMDRDGRLVAAELPGGRGRPVSLAEHRRSLAEAFRRQDMNGDGVLDARELATPPR